MLTFMLPPFSLFPADSLNISSFSTWTSLAPGGHSFLFRARVNSRVCVLKIFRFPHTFPALPPYTYFLREASAYTRLSGLPTVPQCHGFLSIPASLEAQLLPTFQARGFTPAKTRHLYGATAESMPLVAVWMEEVIGSRLERRGVDGVVAAEVLKGLGEIHERGVVQGDIKWRNILVEEGTGSVRWVDFSNAAVKGSMEQEEWQVLVDKETRECRKMLRLPVEDGDDHQRTEGPEQC